MAGLGGQQVDHLVADERGVDVHHDHARRAPRQTVRLYGDVNAPVGGHLDQVGAELVALRTLHQEFVAPHREAGEPVDAIDVPAAGGDGAGHDRQIRGLELGSEGGDHQAFRMPGRRGVDDLEVHLEAPLVAEQQHFLDEVPAGRHRDREPERELTADDDLLHVLHVCTGIRQQAEQVGGDARAVGAGHPDEDRVPRRCLICRCLVWRRIVGCIVLRAHRPAQATGLPGYENPGLGRRLNPCRATDLSPPQRAGIRPGPEPCGVRPA